MTTELGEYIRRGIMHVPGPSLLTVGRNSHGAIGQLDAAAFAAAIEDFRVAFNTDAAATDMTSTGKGDPFAELIGRIDRYTSPDPPPHTQGEATTNLPPTPGGAKPSE